MNPSLAFLAALLASGTLTRAAETEARVSNAVRALPAALQEGASVVAFDEGGKSIVLREGTNNLICWADEPTPGFFVACFPKSKEPYELRRRELRGNDRWREILDAEIQAGKIPMPDLAVRYELGGDTFETALPILIVHIPYATPESTGLSTEPDPYRPWLMLAGTSRAHIMVPGK